MTNSIDTQLAVRSVVLDDSTTTRKLRSSSFQWRWYQSRHPSYRRVMQDSKLRPFWSSLRCFVFFFCRFLECTFSWGLWCVVSVSLILCIPFLGSRFRRSVREYTQIDVNCRPLCRLRWSRRWTRDFHHDQPPFTAMTITNKYQHTIFVRISLTVYTFTVYISL